jgi:hypothetical protein
MIAHTLRHSSSANTAAQDNSGQVRPSIVSQCTRQATI